MITIPTVLILGAGASEPYGYPTGGGLVENIIQSVSRTDWREVYPSYGVTPADMGSLRSELLQSQQPSIDAFLEHRPQFLKQGKLAMAMSLLSREVPELFIDLAKRERGFYNFLYNSLTASWEELKENKLAVVTFNYDRTLEHFLFTAVSHTYGKSDAEVAVAIKCVPIIHVHGSLGPLPWQAEGGYDYRPIFAGERNAREIERRITVATENIKIVSEAQPQTIEFESAIARIREAKRVYFLGFGYHRANMERLGLSTMGALDVSLKDIFRYGSSGYTDADGAHHDSERITPKLYRGSALGLGFAQIQSIQNDWRIGLMDNTSDALQFLKDHAPLD